MTWFIGIGATLGYLSFVLFLVLVAHRFDDDGDDDFVSPSHRTLRTPPCPSPVDGLDETPGVVARTSGSQLPPPASFVPWSEVRRSPRVGDKS